MMESSPEATGSSSGTGGCRAEMHAPDVRLLAVPEDVWRGRVDTGEQGDTRRLFNIVKHLPLPLHGGSQCHAPENPGKPENLPPQTPTLLGFACDAGVRRNQGRVGAAEGPQAIRRMLAGLPAHAFVRWHDAGDIRCEGDALEAAQEALAARVHELLMQQQRLLVLGGGHEIAWGSWQGLRRYLDAREDGAPVLILNLDAHFDLRTSRPGSSGTPFDQMAEATAAAGLPFHYAVLGISQLGNTPALFSRARALGVRWVEDVEMQAWCPQDIQKRLDVLLEAVEHVYLSIDLDVLPGAVMPAVSAPAAYGVPLPVIEAAAMHVAASGKLRLVDMAEFNPHHDQDQRGARTAARLAWQVQRAWAQP